MKLPEEQVLWVAKLAQIELTEEEKHRFAEDLSNTITYIDELSAVDVSGIPEGLADNSQITGLTNVSRADVVVTSDIPREQFLERSPESSSAYIKVKRVIEK